MGPLDLAAATAEWPVGRSAVAVVDATGPIDHHGSDESFPWASVTKLLTALTVLDAWADGTVDLDEPAGPAGATVRHLLAHTSGLPFEGDQPVSAPDKKRIYSNTGYEMLADHLARAAGGPFADELFGRVLEPLGLHATSLAGSPASGAVGPIEDLARLAHEFLVASALGPEVIGAASTLAYPGLAGILPGFGRQSSNDWGLGCEIRDHKSPHWTSPENSPATFGHFGQSGSFLWVDPAVRLACVSLSDRAFGPWAGQVWPILSTAVLRAYRS